ncbi:MAG: hypothetical protein KatS3mg105_3368 [Gemmatales bacterium]|nr:MAG: hypothetical protein KatS3mg105_3368 [Gemmatales bacterium]
MYKRYGDKIQFFVVYIREAHPNSRIPQPSKLEQRVDIAKTMCQQLKLSLPTLIDGMDNKTGIAYGGFPDRLYLVGKDGRIVYKGARGPFGFKPNELEAAIQKELASK